MGQWWNSSLLSLLSKRLKCQQPDCLSSTLQTTNTPLTSKKLPFTMFRCEQPKVFCSLFRAVFISILRTCFTTKGSLDNVMSCPQHFFLERNAGISGMPPRIEFERYLLSWESKGTPPMPPPPGNKALLRDY